MAQFVESEQYAPGIDPWDKNPNYIWNPPRPDRDGGGNCVPENGGLPDDLAHGFHVASDDGSWVTVRADQVMRVS